MKKVPQAVTVQEICAAIIAEFANFKAETLVGAPTGLTADQIDLNQIFHNSFSFFVDHAEHDILDLDDVDYVFLIEQFLMRHFEIIDVLSFKKQILNTLITNPR